MVRFLWFSSCHWKCSGAVVVLQKRVFTNNFKPIFSLFVRGRLYRGVCYRPYLDSHQMLDSAAKGPYFASTVFNLCCVSVDRFIAIRFPFRYQDIITKKRCYAVIIMVWLNSLFLPFSRILLDNRTNIEKLWFSLTFITFVFPLSVVSLCYFWIFKIARKQSRRIKRENLQNPQENSATVDAIQNHKAIKTIGFVLGVFIVSWMPSLVVSVVDFVTAGDKCVDHRLVYIVWPWIEAIAFTSSAINPWIYCFRNGEFREALRLNFYPCPCLRSRTSPECTIEPDGHNRVQIVNCSFQLRQ